MINLSLGELVKIKDIYFNIEDHPGTGVIVKVVKAYEHELRAVRNIASSPENSDINIVSLMLSDGSIKEYFEDEIENV